MTNHSEEEAAKAEAAEYVVDRVESWDEGAEPETVEADLRKGFDQAGVEVDDRTIGDMAQHIHDEGSAHSGQSG